MKKFLSVLIATFSVAVYAGSPVIWGPNFALNLKSGGIQLQNGHVVANDGTVNYLTNPILESGLTTGFSLGHVTLTSGIPTGTPTFGSGASGNLALTVSTSSPIEGSYSLQVASSAATTAGDFVASDAFTIQNANLTNVVYFTFQYQATTNPTNVNFSGTSSNSFMPYIYNVTQGGSTWIQPSGLYCEIQGVGVGTCTGSFQATTTDTQYRLVIYNANATAGAATMRYDAFLAGPASPGQAASVVAWSGSQVSQGVTANVTDIAFTTINDSSGAWNGTQYVVPAAGSYVMSGGFQSAGTTGFGYKNGVQIGSFATSPAGSFSGGSIVFTNCKAGDTLSLRANTSVTVTNGNLGVFLVGGSSSSGLGGVVAAKITSGTISGAGSGAAIAFTSPVVDFDSAGMWSAANNYFVVPVSGYYIVTFQVTNPVYGVAGGTVAVKLNGSTSPGNDKVFYTWNTSTFAQAGSFAVPLRLNAGDTVGLSTDNSISSAAWANFGLAMIPGPPSANVNSTPTVAASYWVSANFAATTSVPINFDTKEFDTCSCVTPSATVWKFTAPSVGTYTLSLYAVATTAPAEQLKIYKNGAAYKNLCAANTNTAIFSTCSTGLRLSANDTIDIRPTASLTFNGGTLTSGLAGTIFIQKTGN